MPAGKTIFIDPLTGDQSLTVSSPLFVVVDDRGMIRQRPLTSSDRSAAQQGTTPGAVVPALDLGDAGVDGAGIIGGGSLVDEGTILQDTEQGDHCPYP